MNNIDISKTALVSTLAISLWSGRKHEIEVDHLVDETFGSKSGGSYIKALLAQTYLSEIASISTAARAWHQKNTLPWMLYGSGRLLPTSTYFEYIETMNKYKSDYEKAVKTFLDKYDEAVEAAKNKLGSLYKKTDYPSREVLASKYKFSLAISPVITPEGLVVDLIDDVVESIKNNISEELDNAKERALSSLFWKLNSTVDALYKKLSDTTAIFRSSTVTAVFDSIESCRALNVFDNQDLVNACDYIDKKLGSIDIGLLRESEEYRLEKAYALKDIYDKLQDYV